MDRVKPVVGRRQAGNILSRWKREIHRLWEEVGNFSGERRPRGEEGHKQNGHTLKSRRGFGHSVCTAMARPGNKAVRACTEAVLSLLRKTDVGDVKAGVLSGDAG